MGLLMKVNLAE